MYIAHEHTNSSQVSQTRQQHILNSMCTYLWHTQTHTPHSATHCTNPFNRQMLNCNEFAHDVRLYAQFMYIIRTHALIYYHEPRTSIGVPIVHNSAHNTYDRLCIALYIAFTVGTARFAMHSIRHSRSILLTREQWNIALYAVHVLLSSTRVYKLINCIVSIKRYFFMQSISAVHQNVSRNIRHTSVDNENDDDWSFNICLFAWNLLEYSETFSWSFRMISKSCIYIIFTHQYKWQWMCAHDWHLRMK